MVKVLDERWGFVWRLGAGRLRASVVFVDFLVMVGAIRVAAIGGQVDEG